MEVPEGADVQPSLALYIHVPYCAEKCGYCDFYSLPRRQLPGRLEAPLVEATLRRAESLARRFGLFSEGKIPGGFSTIYIGGGTPTALSDTGFDRLLSSLAALVHRQSLPLLEWTVEANPESLTDSKLAIMARHGVTRISLGVQSLDADELKLLGRIHSPETALKAVSRAAQSGFAVSADLMAVLPKLPPSASATKSEATEKPRSYPPRDPGTLAGFAQELVAMGAGHLSVYDLTLEEGTPLYSARRSLDFPDEDTAWEERHLLEESLIRSGFRRYEVSNYAKPGRESLHNLHYWCMDSYIGAGPGAVSTLRLPQGRSLRIEEAKNAIGYVGQAETLALETQLDFKDTVFESVMMAFRTSFGLNIQAFSRRFNLDARSLLGKSLAKWKDHIVAGEAWPASAKAFPGVQEEALALDGKALDLLNRFLGDCLEEIEDSL